jgi:hypothetical protein
MCIASGNDYHDVRPVTIDILTDTDVTRPGALRRMETALIFDSGDREAAERCSEVVGDHAVAGAAEEFIVGYQLSAGHLGLSEAVRRVRQRFMPAAAAYG